jgi:hypothetical protein
MCAVQQRTYLTGEHLLQLGSLRSTTVKFVFLINRSGEVHSILEYTHFPSTFFAILYASLPLTFFPADANLPAERITESINYLNTGV